MQKADPDSKSKQKDIRNKIKFPKMNRLLKKKKKRRNPTQSMY